MRYRQLGASDLEVPVIIFGAWAVGGWAWGGSDDKQAVDTIRAAIDHGITAVDTAPVYGFGRSEHVVGRALKGRREHVILMTKCGIRWDDANGTFHYSTEDAEQGRPIDMYRNLKADSIIRECEDSLRRLDTDRIDLYQCHWPDKSTPAEETMSALLKLREQGKIRHIGVSNFTVDMIIRFRALGEIVSDQPKYNLLERRIETNILPYAAKNKLGVVAYSPLAQGLLTGKVTMDRTFPAGDFRRDKPWFKPVNRRRVLDALAAVRSVAETHGITPANLAAAWTVHQPGMTAAIVGARSPEQAAENARAGEVSLSRDELDTINNAFAGLTKPD